MNHWMKYVFFFEKIASPFLFVYGLLMFIVCFFGKMIWEILTVPWSDDE